VSYGMNTANLSTLGIFQEFCHLMENYLNVGILSTFTLDDDSDGD
jgi:hypothetical protein